MQSSCWKRSQPLKHRKSSQWNVCCKTSLALPGGNVTCIRAVCLSWKHIFFSMCLGEAICESCEFLFTWWQANQPSANTLLINQQLGVFISRDFICWIAYWSTLKLRIIIIMSSPTAVTMVCVTKEDWLSEIFWTDWLFRLGFKHRKNIAQTRVCMRITAW